VCSAWRYLPEALAATAGLDTVSCAAQTGTPPTTVGCVTPKMRTSIPITHAHGLTKFESSDHSGRTERETRLLIGEWRESIDDVSAALSERSTLTQAHLRVRVTRPAAF